MAIGYQMIYFLIVGIDKKNLEEMSLAYENKIYSGNGNQWYGKMSDGTTLVICIGNGSDPNKTITVWPRAF